VAIDTPVDLKISNLTTYSYATCDLIGAHDKSAVGLVETK